MGIRMTEHGFPVALGEIAGLSATHGDWPAMAPLLRAIWRWVQLVIAEERLAEKHDECARLRPLLERCLAETEDAARKEKAADPDAPFNQDRVNLLADLRRELEKEA